MGTGEVARAAVRPSGQPCTRVRKWGGGGGAVQQIQNVPDTSRRGQKVSRYPHNVLSGVWISSECA